LWAIYKQSPKSRADRAKGNEYIIDKIVYAFCLVMPYFILPAMVMHFHKELLDFLKGNAWDKDH
jgi:hypothetical protein